MGRMKGKPRTFSFSHSLFFLTLSLFVFSSYTRMHKRDLFRVRIFITIILFNLQHFRITFFI